MKPRSLPALFFSTFLFAQSHAQYCTPTVGTTGIYFTAVHFNAAGTSGISSGVEYSNGAGSSGYSDNTVVSSGTIVRDCSVAIPFDVQNDAASAVDINVRVFADWNNDNDFDDANELVYDFDTNIPGLSALPSGTALGWSTPPNPPSTVRIRLAVREDGSKADACGSYTGEVLDFSLDVAANNAPDINTLATAFLNPLKESQTDNEGTSTLKFFTSSLSGAMLTADADACSTGALAITNTSGNGQWQFKIDNGAWTDFGAVSDNNALLLSPSSNNRIRFVPAGPGSADFTYRAWDRSTGADGLYADVTAAGGTTAFSTNSSTASILVYSDAATSGDVKVYMGTLSSPNNTYNIRSISLDRTNGIMKQPDLVTTDDINGTAIDIAIDNTANKLVWIGGASNVSLLRSDLDGNNIETLSNAFITPTGIAIGNGKIFIMDFAVGIFSCNTDGSGMAPISGGAGQANDIAGTGDIEFATNKIYYVNSPDFITYNIMQANPDGTGTVQLYTTSLTIISGLTVTGSTLYWTENDGVNGTIKSIPLTGGSETTVISEPNLLYGRLMVDQNNSNIYFSALNLPSYDNASLRIASLSGGTSTRLLDMENVPGGLILQSGLSTLPVHFVNVKAFQDNTSIQVQWNIAMEENLSKYIVEKSADGRQFTDAGSVPASNINHYEWLDRQPYSGRNYYRIKAINIDRSVQYSNIVSVNTGKKEAAISIYPTIVSNGQFNLRLENANQGTYRISVINMSGQQVFAQTMAHTGGSSVQTINLPAMLSGVYRLKIAGRSENWVETIVVK